MKDSVDKFKSLFNKKNIIIFSILVVVLISSYFLYMEYKPKFKNITIEAGTKSVSIRDFLTNAILEAKEKHMISTKDISDGYHTFGELYIHRITLFCLLCNFFPDLSWKSKKHYNDETDPMFEGSFIAGIKTPLGDAIYHVKLNYWDEFNIPEVENAPQYDGHKSEEDLIRLKSLHIKNK